MSIKDSSPPPASASESDTPQARPTSTSVAAAVCGLQGVALVVWGLVQVVGPLFTHPDSIGRAEVGGLVLAALGALPLAAAHGLRTGRRWSRGPAVTIQLFCLPVGWELANSSGALVWAGVGAAVVAVVALIGLFHPDTGRALGVGQTDTEDET